MERLQGVVVSEPWAVGSKSEHEAVQLDTGERRWLLRRVGASPFEDDAFAPLVGQRVVVTGRPHGAVFFAEAWQLLDEDGSGDDRDRVEPDPPGGNPALGADELADPDLGVGDDVGRRRGGRGGRDGGD